MASRPARSHDVEPPRAGRDPLPPPQGGEAAVESECRAPGAGGSPPAAADRHFAAWHPRWFRARLGAAPTGTPAESGRRAARLPPRETDCLVRGSRHCSLPTVVLETSTHEPAAARSHRAGAATQQTPPRRGLGRPQRGDASRAAPSPPGARPARATRGGGRRRRTGSGASRLLTCAPRIVSAASDAPRTSLAARCYRSGSLGTCAGSGARWRSSPASRPPAGAGGRARTSSTCPELPRALLRGVEHREPGIGRE